MCISVPVCAGDQRAQISLVLEVVLSHSYGHWKPNSDFLEEKYTFLPCLAISPAQGVTSHKLTTQQSDVLHNLAPPNFTLNVLTCIWKTFIAPLVIYSKPIAYQIPSL